MTMRHNVALKIIVLKSFGLTRNFICLSFIQSLSRGQLLRAKMKYIQLLIVNYTSLMQSAIIGLKEMFILASQFTAKFTEQSQSEVDTKRRSKFDNRFAVDNIDRILEQ